MVLSLLFFCHYQIHRENFCILRMINYYLNVKNCRHMRYSLILREPFVLSLKELPRSLSVCTACVSDDGLIYHRWSFFFFSSSLKITFFFCLVFQLQTLFIWFLIFFLGIFVKLLFIFNFIIQSQCHILYFLICSLFFWFLIFFLGLFVKVFLVFNF